MRGSEFRTQVFNGINGHQDVNSLKLKPFILTLFYFYLCIVGIIQLASHCMCHLFAIGNAMLSGAEAHLPWSGVRFQSISNDFNSNMDDSQG